MQFFHQKDNDASIISGENQQSGVALILIHENNQMYVEHIRIPKSGEYPELMYDTLSVWKHRGSLGEGLSSFIMQLEGIKLTGHLNAIRDELIRGLSDIATG